MLLKLISALLALIQSASVLVTETRNREDINTHNGTHHLRFRGNGSGSITRYESRDLVTAPYHVLTTTQLGRPNLDAGIGNPMKGLMESPIYTWPPYKADIPLALEFYYIGACLCVCVFSCLLHAVCACVAKVYVQTSELPSKLIAIVSFSSLVKHHCQASTSS
jgi:hypothetical protein